MSISTDSYFVIYSCENNLLCFQPLNCYTSHNKLEMFDLSLVFTSKRASADKVTSPIRRTLACERSIHKVDSDSAL